MKTQPFQPPARKLGQLTYGEFLEWAAANNKPPRPIGRFETNPPPLSPIAQTAQQPRTDVVTEIDPDLLNALPDA